VYDYIHVLNVLIGLLPAVVSLEATFSSDFIYFTWTPPFTLDITDVEPDISGYCIDIINSTTSSTLYSLCGINETEFIFPTPPDNGCQGYIACTVIPVNAVGNGTMAISSNSLAGEEIGIIIKEH
jgi:hypothetical protein